MEAVLQTKGNLTSVCNRKLKFNAFRIYVVPIAVHASQITLPSKGNYFELDRLHHHPQHWTVGLELDYRNKL